MVLILTIVMVVIVFLATRFGFKSKEKNVRIISYVGVFISIALLVYLLTAYITQRIADNLPIL